MTVIQSVLIKQRRMADDSSNLSHMIVDELQHRIWMTFAEATDWRHRRNKLRADGFTDAIVMKVEYFIAQLTAETFAVSRQTFISGKTHLPKIARKKCFFSFKTFFSVRFFQISFKRREKETIL